MPFFTSTLLKASLVALLSAGYVKATPIPAAPGYSSQNGPTPGVSVSGFSYTGLNMQNGTDLHHRGNSNETAPASLVKRTTGDIEAHWQFSDLETVCGDFGAVCFSPSAHLWVNWYANGNSNPTCSDYWDITIESSSNQLSGKPFYSQNCDIYVIFDGNGNGGTVESYGAGHGVNCGWVTSWDHTSYLGGLVPSDDYYFHCTW